MFPSRIKTFSRIAINLVRLPMSTSALRLPKPTVVNMQNGSQITYENAVSILNTLQSNAETIARSRARHEITRSSCLPQVRGALQTCGFDIGQLESLGVIHVAGTKGKGMTCAFTESILRHAGLKTGFFSSPHLISVRERIRINGKPISENSFAHHFFSLYNKLKHLKEPNAPFEMPHYFRFLTCMAFHVFVEEKVDVVILEVGIGGRFDSTNVIRKPVVVGITSLALEHQVILGDTLEEIAFQKAGIMKSGVPAYTVDSHPPHVTQVLRSNAQEVQCPLYCISSQDYQNGNVPLKLGIDDGIVSRTNAALAIHLANQFLLLKHPEMFPITHSIPKSSVELMYSSPSHFLPFHIKGLMYTKWEGRFQIYRYNERVTFYLDGAHTTESLKIASSWFQKVTNSSALRVLIFNVTGERSAESFLKLLANTGYIDIAIFCPLVTSTQRNCKDNWAKIDAGKDLTAPCKEQLRIWTDLNKKESRTNYPKGIVCPCAESAIQYINNNLSLEKSIDVLVTGSVRLVGTFLTVLTPNLND